MKVKFLVPDINEEKFAKDLQEKFTREELELKSFKNIATEDISEQLTYNYLNGINFPSINRFLAICRYFDTSPDNFLTPIAKWVECEMDDISKFSVLGTFNDTYYVVPNKLGSYCGLGKELLEEPDPSLFSIKFTESNYYEIESNGDITYKIPSVKENETSDLIAKYLSEYKITDEQLEILLGYNQSESIRRLLNKLQTWPLEKIYKLSWILNKPFESLIEIDYREKVKPGFFNPIVYHKYNRSKGEPVIEFKFDEESWTEEDIKAMSLIKFPPEVKFTPEFELRMRKYQIEDLQEELYFARDTIAKVEQQLKEVLQIIKNFNS